MTDYFWYQLVLPKPLPFKYTYTFEFVAVGPKSNSKCPVTLGGIVALSRNGFTGKIEIAQLKGPSDRPLKWSRNLIYSVPLYFDSKQKFYSNEFAQQHQVFIQSQGLTVPDGTGGYLTKLAIALPSCLWV